MKDIIDHYYRFNAWANRHILDTSSELSPEQYFAETNPSLGSVHNTLVHIMSAQWLWLNRCQGVSLKTMLDPKSFSSLAELRTNWDDIENHTNEFVLACSGKTLVETLSYQNIRGEACSYPLWQMMLHQVNHATQHRSETALILTQLGHSTGAMDFLVYIDEEDRKS